MKSKVLAVLALSVGLAVPAAYAQQSASQSQPAQPAAVTGQADQAEVTGTIVTLSADRIDVKIDAVTAPESATAGSSIVVGNTTAFALNSSTDMPQGLKVGDRVNLWFANDNGSLKAARLALAPAGDQSAASSQSSSTSSSSSAASPADQSASGTSSPADQSASGASSTAEQSSSSSSSMSDSATSTSTAQPSSSAADATNPSASSTSAHRANLPKTGSPLPLIGLLGIAALASVLVLRFVLRA
jgi:hypothetical protein